jgi:hypothetical protein
LALGPPPAGLLPTTRVPDVSETAPHDGIRRCGGLAPERSEKF